MKQFSRTKYSQFVFSILLFIFSAFSFSAPNSFTEAKVLSKTQVYADQNHQGEGTIYCGCEWEWVGKSGGKVDLASCGYQVRKQQNRAERIEWEHIVPAWVFGHQRQCWQKGGRKNCVSSDPVFGQMEANLHNLAPSIGEVNGDRSNFSFGQLSANTPYPYGMCRSRVDFKERVFEPRDEAKGQVARVYFYMHDRYNLSMSRQQQQLLMAWDSQYPPTPWEIIRDNRIAKVMGHHNPFVTGEKKWRLNHKNGAEGVNISSVSLSTQPQTIKNKPIVSNVVEIKGNRNSNKYHFSHCPSFNTIADKNAVIFMDEQAAKAAGFQLAGNCKTR
ncbi:endonuclease [Providencia huaxiensis]|uniref:endonuclease n=1 Tax=Providencia huaxiensis TaxID=2027290 RepID=UPI003D81B799